MNTSFGREHEPFWGKKNDIMAWLVCEIVLQLCCAITARASTSAFPTLITEDKDFGELTYRLQKPNHGILLVRLTYSSANQKAKAVLEVMENHADKLQGAFSVLDEHRLRIRSL